ncbi:MAG: bifunctional phosphopantothenoylcysteine decarboxylase/phosphopantothenate--cysteine ligase CoaBC [Bacteroidetes bacterium]|nr:bifunctional phosphopantothenoylcysteine decarboxylase/phosphopantothenate--cysteine ligase CoaBC [Bacteroidota bacterium]
MLQNKKIVLCISGSIAAYKAAFLIRLLVKNGCEVKIVMTKSATNFITPLTLSTLSKNIVLTDTFDKETGNWNNHVEIAKWADLLLIAPASANTIAKMANGICDNLLCAVYLSANCPVVVAPAMDLDMYKHPTTTANIEKLKSFKCKIIPVENGELASGLYGDGRMAEPENIIKFIDNFFSQKKKTSNLKVLVTAGPTQEKIDSVRFISNHSSGKMGVAIANCFFDYGADVTLIAGPIEKHNILSNIKVIDVISAKQMLEQCEKYSKTADVIVMAAAVADYTPQEVLDKKIKKNNADLTIKLVKTEDIIKKLGKNKTKGQIIVGFALEDQNELKNAEDKLKSKNLDLIILNSLNDKGAGFKSEFNKVTFIDKKKNKKTTDLKLKTEIANEITNEIVKLIKK